MIGTFGWSVLATLNIFIGGALVLTDRETKGYVLWIAGAVCLVMAWWRL